MFKRLVNTILFLPMIFIWVLGIFLSPLCYIIFNDNGKITEWADNWLSDVF